MSLISGIQTALVPKAVFAKNPAGGRLFYKIRTAEQVAFQFPAVIGFIGLKGEIYLMDRRSIQQELSLSGKKGTVGGDHDLESESLRFVQKSRKLRMEKRLAQQMIIQIFGESSHFRGKNMKLLRTEHTRRTFGTGTEGAAEIADIADLQIDFTETHILSTCSFLRRRSIHAKLRKRR